MDGGRDARVKEAKLLGFEIWKNGKKLAVAGLTDGGAVSLMLTWVGKGAGASARAASGVEIDGLDLRVGGIDSSDPTGDHSIEWIEDTALRLGDDIQIRLVSTHEIDTPMRREPTKTLTAGETAQKLAHCTVCGAIRIREAPLPAE
jgi:hypothetical protein